MSTPLGDADRRDDFAASLEMGLHPLLNTSLYARDDDTMTASDARRIQNRKAARVVRKTHCHRGHAFTHTNTYITPDGHRQCRACKNDGQQRRAQKRKENDQ